MRIIGDFALLRPARLAFVELVTEINREWVVLNPAMQSDMVTECVVVGTQGRHSLSDAPVTDLACVVTSSNGYTFMQMETLADWAIARNAAAQGAQGAAMGGGGPGLLQDTWIVANCDTGEELMR